MKLVLQSGACDAVTGFWGIPGFFFFAGTFPLPWLRRSVRGFSYCLFPIAFNPLLSYTSNISINRILHATERLLTRYTLRISSGWGVALGPSSGRGAESWPDTVKLKGVEGISSVAATSPEAMSRAIRFAESVPA